MNGPHDQEGPERRGYKIGQAGEGVEKRPRDHEVSFGDSQKSFSHEGTKDQGGDTENSNKKTDLSLFGSESQEINWNGRDKKAEDRGESKLGEETEEETGT
jgi:hypothetical protein